VLSLVAISSSSGDQDGGLNRTACVCGEKMSGVSISEQLFKQGGVRSQTADTDLNSFHYFLRDFLKDAVYKRNPHTINEMQQEI
jgi:hypothetical protein